MILYGLQRNGLNQFQDNLNVTHRLLKIKIEKKKNLGPHILPSLREFRPGIILQIGVGACFSCQPPFPMMLHSHHDGSIAPSPMVYLFFEVS